MQILIDKGSEDFLAKSVQGQKYLKAGSYELLVTVIYQ